MREWLSGGAPPCQGGGRGFDPRLVLAKKRHPFGCLFFCEHHRISKFDRPGTNAPSRLCRIRDRLLSIYVSSSSDLFPCRMQ